MNDTAWTTASANVLTEAAAAVCVECIQPLHHLLEEGKQLFQAVGLEVNFSTSSVGGTHCEGGMALLDEPFAIMQAWGISVADDIVKTTNTSCLKAELEPMYPLG